MNNYTKKGPGRTGITTGKLSRKTLFKRKLSRDNHLVYVSAFDPVELAKHHWYYTVTKDMK